MASEITTREQAEAVARWMGWKRRNGDAHLPWMNPSGKPVYRIPTYADSLDAMREVEDLLAERELMFEYTDALLDLHDVERELDEYAFLIRATAAQRLQAAFEVIKEVESAG